MHDLYKVETQKTWKGKTAGGWIKKCTIEQSMAGEVFVWLTVDNANYQVVLSDDGDMVLTDYDGIVVVLEMSDRAQKILERMELQADALNRI